MFSRIRTAVCTGIEGRSVCVETEIARGLPGIFIVGLASTTVMESRERIKSAFINSGFDYPKGRITVNLTPASLRKNSSGLDLPIAVGILASCMYVDMTRASEYGIIGELSLDGRVMGVRGVLPMLLGMKGEGISKAIVPEENAAEASLIRDMKIYTCTSLGECVQIIETGEGRTAVDAARSSSQDLHSRAENTQVIAAGDPGGGKFSTGAQQYPQGAPDYADISGQETAKRAIVIAVTGRHGLLMVGSPGCGKTMLSSRIPTIMTAMTEEELIETAVIYSAVGRTDTEDDALIRRPFRHPHHTIGRAGLIGGGTYPVPGEITLAHNGVLFLDEICEFSRENIEGLRIPMEEKKITHFRQGDAYTFPCDCQIVMAANPCPCGYYGDPDRLCRCSEVQLQAYRKKLSGPIRDRMDMMITMEKVTYDQLTASKQSISSEEMRRQVEAGMNYARSSGRAGWNAAMSEDDTGKWCRLSGKELAFMSKAYDSFKLSPRSYKKILKVARTIADIDQSEVIRQEHLAEALSYRLPESAN